MKSILLTILTVVSFAYGTIITVCPSGCDYTTETAAANGASVGDTIQINSTYDTLRIITTAIVMKQNQLLRSAPGNFDTLRMDASGFKMIDPSSTGTKIQNICLQYSETGESASTLREANGSSDRGGTVDSNVLFMNLGAASSSRNCFEFGTSANGNRVVDCIIIGFGGFTHRSFPLTDSTAQPNLVMLRNLFDGSSAIVPAQSTFSYNIVLYNGENSLSGGYNSVVSYNYFNNLGGSSEFVTMDNSRGCYNWSIHHNIYDSCSHVKLSIDGARYTTIRNERFDTTLSAEYDIYTHSSSDIYDSCYNWNIERCFFKGGYNVNALSFHHNWLNLDGLMMISGADLAVDSVFFDTLQNSLWFGTKGTVQEIFIPTTDDTVSGVTLADNIIEGSRFPFLKQDSSNTVITRLAAGDTIGPLLYLTNKIERTDKNDTGFAYACSLSFDYAWEEPTKGDTATVYLQDSTAGGWATVDSSVNLVSREISSTDGSAIGKRDTLVFVSGSAGTAYRMRFVTVANATGLTFYDTSFSWPDTTSGTGGTTQFTLTYDGNTATGGSTSDTTVDSGTVVEISENGFTKTDSTFIGWNTASDSSGTWIYPTVDFQINSDTTVYAIWMPDSFVYFEWDAEDTVDKPWFTKMWDYSTLSEYNPHGGSKCVYYRPQSGVQASYGVDVRGLIIHSITDGKTIYHRWWMRKINYDYDYKFKASRITPADPRIYTGYVDSGAIQLLESEFIYPLYYMPGGPSIEYNIDSVLDNGWTEIVVAVTYQTHPDSSNMGYALWVNGDSIGEARGYQSTDTARTYTEGWITWCLDVYWDLDPDGIGVPAENDSAGFYMDDYQVSSSFNSIFGTVSPPVVVLNPVDTSIYVDSTAVFIAAATEATSQQWQIYHSSSWSDTSGQTAASFSWTINWTDRDGDSVRCIFTNASGSDTTTAAHLHVFPQYIVDTTWSGVETWTITEGLTVDSGKVVHMVVTAPTGSDFGDTVFNGDFPSTSAIDSFTIVGNVSITAYAWVKPIITSVRVWHLVDSVYSYALKRGDTATIYVDNLTATGDTSAVFQNSTGTVRMTILTWDNANDSIVVKSNASSPPGVYFTRVRINEGVLSDTDGRKFYIKVPRNTLGDL